MVRLCPNKRELGIILLSSCCFTLSLSARERAAPSGPKKNGHKIAYLLETSRSRATKEEKRPKRGREVTKASTFPVSSEPPPPEKKMDPWDYFPMREGQNCQCPVCTDDAWECEPQHLNDCSDACDSCGEDVCCCYYLRGLIGYGAGKTVGLDKSYFQVGLQLGSTAESGNFYKAIEANGYFLDGKQYAWNIGAMMRWYDSEMCSYYGINVFYDYREGRFGPFQQVGLGYEAYFPCFTLTGNAYIPVGKKCAYGPKKVYDDYEGDYVAICRETELAMCGFNLEIGREFCPNECFVLHPGIGPYFFSHTSKSFWGVRFRTRLRYESRWGIDFQLTHDSVFDTRAQALFYISFPIGFGSEDCCCEPCDFFFEPVDRFDVVPLGKCCSWEWNW